MIWVITSDTNICRIYQYNKPDKLILLKEISHPENKLKDIDLISDRQGHYNASNSSRGAYSPHTDPKQVKIDEFTREIANELDQGRNKNSYEKLIIISPSHTSGLLFQHLNKHVKELVINKIHKDLLHLSDHELLSFLQDNVKYPDIR